MSQYYVPGLGEKDPDKTIRSLMQAHEKTATNTTNIATNTAAIAALNAATYVNSFKTRTGVVVPAQGDYPTSLIPGTTTNDNATSGNIGEYSESALTSASPVSLTTDTAANIVNISLTAGDWDVTGVAGFTGASSTTVNYMRGSISATSNTLGGENARSVQIPAGATIFSTTGAITIALVTLRASLSATTTYYLVSQAGFGVSTMSGFGQIRARRVR